ncbi:hypothetical protein BX661DRAFT_189228 [Kickxella alabastrina]|uniref:uncharacterized protein n=1 Tax=Kickxella alabastrina TaxID=61397 RepID=UPI002220EDA9|nr:uncharacterized protein BX661DRAFT_189228 [Kickxella alabastrina]KAI7820336.1 hypothetical protein BX661DRAFT_189228 [Kickxella alabastrina]
MQMPFFDRASQLQYTGAHVAALTLTLTWIIGSQYTPSVEGDQTHTTVFAQRHLFHYTSPYIISAVYHSHAHSHITKNNVCLVNTW